MLSLQASGWAARRAHALVRIAAAILLITAAAATPLRAAEPLRADRIVVFKAKRELVLLYHGKVVKTYRAELGRHPVGPKEQQGDGRTPEGLYLIDGRHPDSPYHRALHVSYPSDVDVQRAQAKHVDPGDAIFIHGLPAGFGWADPARYFKDWTAGCIAVANEAIDEIWSAIDNGTPIEILP